MHAGVPDLMYRPVFNTYGRSAVSKELTISSCLITGVTFPKTGQTVTVHYTGEHTCTYINSFHAPVVELSILCIIVNSILCVSLVLSGPVSRK